MHVVMAIGRRRTKAMIADECIKFEMIVYRRRGRERGRDSTLNRARRERFGKKWRV